MKATIVMGVIEMRWMLMACGLIALGGCDIGTTNETAAVSDGSWMTCPDELKGPFRPDSDQSRQTLRTARPSAGGEPDPALYDSARFLPDIYTMYDLYAEDGDPESAFPSDDLTLNALITGNPGRDTERKRVANRTRTLYGFWATDKESGADIIVIRGTMTPIEWVRDIQAAQLPLPGAENGAQVHKGFFEIYESFALDRGPFEGPFVDAVRAGAFSGREVAVTGHSLGGALAVLTATDVARLGTDTVTRLITVASPRVGNPAFRDIAQAIETSVRICNQPDLVTMMPPSTKQLSYVHVGEPRRYSSFDHDDVLDNDLESWGSQVLCWHGIDTYVWMLDPNYSGRGNAQCWK